MSGIPIDSPVWQSLQNERRAIASTPLVQLFAADPGRFEALSLEAEGVFADPGPGLRARLANVVVLPHYGEAVYWHEPGRFVQQLRGQHGGLSAQEMEIPLVAWVA